MSIKSDRYTNISNLKNEFKREENKAIDRELKINTLNKKKEELESIALISAQNEKMEEYIKTKRSIEEIALQIEALTLANKNRNNMHLDINTVKNSWNQYEKERAKELDIHIEKMQSLISSIYDEFKQIATLQNEGLSVRNECAVLCGYEPCLSYFNSASKLESEFPMKYYKAVTQSKLNGGLIPAEARMLINLDMIPSTLDTSETLTNIFGNHFPRKLSCFK